MLDRFIRRLEAFEPLSDGERLALSSIPRRTRRVNAGEDLVEDASRPSACCLVVSGLLCRYKLMQDGRRQILAYDIPGDVCDLQGMFQTMDNGVSAVTGAEVTLLPHATLEELMESFPRIGRALWRLTLADAARYKAWMIGMGRRSAYARVAHFLCEMLARYKDIGLAPEDRCDLPLTQADLADSLGLSIVHVNRTLQRLRAEKLIVVQSRKLTAIDWEGLKAVAEFDASYLHPDGCTLRDQGRPYGDLRLTKAQGAELGGA